MMSGTSDSDRKESARAKVRDQRLEIRCFASEKELLRRAAELDRRTLSNWLLYIALREANKTIGTNRELSDHERDPSLDG